MKRLFCLVLCLAVLAGVFPLALPAAAEEPDAGDAAGTLTFDEATGTYTASYAQAVSGDPYLLLVTPAALPAGAGGAIAPESLEAMLYVDIKTADANGELSFVFGLAGATAFYVYLAGDFGEPDSPPVLLGFRSAPGARVTGRSGSWNGGDDAVYLLYPAAGGDAEILADPDGAALLYRAVTDDVSAGGAGERSWQRFTFSSVPEGDYRLAIRKPGKYVPLLLDIRVEGDTELGELPLWLYGDVNDDGHADDRDAAQIIRYVNLKTSVFDTGGADQRASRVLAADVNGDGEVDGKDAVQIIRYAAEKTSVFDTFS